MPLIHKLSTHSITHIWYADGACVCGSLQDLHQWWDDLLSCSSDYGYSINSSRIIQLLVPHVFKVLVLMLVVMDTNT